MFGSTLIKNFARETLNGKGFGRILFNLELQKRECSGNILDIGSGKNRASLYRFLRMDKNALIKRLDVIPDYKPDFLLDIEKDKVLVADGFFDFVFAFSIIEHLADCRNLLKEVHRILKPRGKLLGSMPFLVNVHPDPHDYVRFTREKLEIIFREAGFKEIEIIAIGQGPFVAAYCCIEFIIPRILRLFSAPSALFLDKLIQKIKPSINFKEKYPIGYMFELKNYE